MPSIGKIAAFEVIGNVIDENLTLRMKVVTVSTLAGSGVEGYADGSAESAQFDYPNGVAIGGDGAVYVADSDNNSIRKIVGGVVSTIAGSGVEGYAEGSGAAAKFYNPYGIAIDNAGTLYVADVNNHRIRKITPAGSVSTLAGSGEDGYADGLGAAALFNYPTGVAVDSAGTVYVADVNNHRIRKITPAGAVSTLAGSGEEGYADGPGAVAQFNYPYGIAVDSAGTVYVADTYNHRIRVITAAGAVSTLAGCGEEGYSDGVGVAARFDYPAGIALDDAGAVYVADSYNNRIRKITVGEVSTIAGSGDDGGYDDGPGAVAQFDYPNGVAIDSVGAVYVADPDNNRIRKITFD
jgi:sugar lactone lactonase YvrE